MATFGVLIVIATSCSAAPSTLPELQAIATQEASSPTVVGTRPAPTLAVVQTQSAATAGAFATAAVPTLQVAATRAAPTVQALSTRQASGTTVPLQSTATAVSALKITSAKTNQADPGIVLRNEGTQPVNLAGWSLLVGSSPVAIPGTIGATVPPQQSVTLHFGQGTSTASDIYLGAASAQVASRLQPGSAIALVDARHEAVTSYSLP
jgi:hypothetical protein